MADVRWPAAQARRPSLQVELQRALWFGQAELVANRAGRITRRQAAQLAVRDAATWIAVGFMAILLLGSIIFVLLVPIALISGRDPPSPFGSLLLTVVVAIGLALLFGWGTMYYFDKARRSLSELRVGAVLTCEGPMSAIEERVRMANGGFSYDHVLLAGGERYEIPFAVYRVLEDGETYRAFFMPESKVVVAIETIDHAGESADYTHHHRGYPPEMRTGQLVFLPLILVLSAAILIAGLLLDNPPAAVLGLGCLLLSGFLVRALVRAW